LKLLLLAGGRASSAPETGAAQDYLKRAAAAGRRIGVTAASLIEIDERRLNYAEALPKGAVLVALDERGENLSSPELAERVRRCLDNGVPAVAFAIGAADGLPEDIRASAQLRIAFGRATWPHMMVRVMASEQIYRSVTILTDHPYHRV
jgi:23S rRNA (pseudouridine1915-N3)-methyltransferase